MTVLEKTVFVGTENGLYRLDSSVWEKLPYGYSGSRLFLQSLELIQMLGFHELLVKLKRTEWQDIEHGDLHFVKLFQFD